MQNVMAYAPQKFGSLWGGWVQGTNKKYRKTVEWRATPGRKLHANLKNSD
jgi:hypothetical protein